MKKTRKILFTLIGIIILCLFLWSLYSGLYHSIWNIFYIFKRTKSVLNIEDKIKLWVIFSISVIFILVIIFTIFLSFKKRNGFIFAIIIIFLTSPVIVGIDYMAPPKYTTTVDSGDVQQNVIEGKIINKKTKYNISIVNPDYILQVETKNSPLPVLLYVDKKTYNKEKEGEQVRKNASEVYEGPVPAHPMS